MVTLFTSVTVVTKCSTSQSVQILILTYLLAIHKMDQHLVDENYNRTTGVINCKWIMTNQMHEAQSRFLQEQQLMHELPLITNGSLLLFEEC